MHFGPHDLKDGTFHWSIINIRNHQVLFTTDDLILFSLKKENHYKIVLNGCTPVFKSISTRPTMPPCHHGTPLVYYKYDWKISRGSCTHKIFIFKSYTNNIHTMNTVERNMSSITPEGRINHMYSENNDLNW